MSSPNAKIVISAIDETKKGVQDAKKNIASLAKDVAGIDLKKAFSIAGVVSGTVAAVKAVGEAIKDCSKEFMEADAAATRFNAIWKNVGDSTGKTARQVMKLADSIELSSDFTAEAVLEAGQLLAATGKLSDEGFDRAIKASADLAASMGTDVTNAAQTLAKALQDPESGLNSLKTAGVTFTDSEKDLIKKLQEEGDTWKAQELILQKVEDRYQGVAKAINNTPLGTLNNIEDVLGNIKKSFGETFVNALSPVLEDIYGWLLKISDWIDERKTNQGINNVFSIFKNPEEYLGGWKAQLDALPAGIVQDAYDALSAGVSKKLNIAFADFKDEIESTGFDFGMLFDLLNRSSEDISRIGKAAGFSQEAIDAILSYQQQHDIDVDTLAYLDKYLSVRHGNYVEWTPEEEQAYLNSLSTPVVKSLNGVAEQLRAQTIVGYYQKKGQNSQDYWERMQVAYNNGKGNTMGGQTTTHLPAMEIVVANPDAIATPVTDKLKAIETAAEYATSSTMLERWKKMTVAGQRQMTQLGIDATPQADIQMERWKAMTVAGQKEMAYYSEQAKIQAEQIERYETMLAGTWALMDEFGWTRRNPASDSGGGEVIEAISNMIDMLDGAAGALADLVASAGPLGIIIWMLNEIFGAFMSQLNDLINQALAPFVEVLHWIGRELANVFAPILDLVGRWLSLIGNLLQTVLGPVISLIAAPLKMIAALLDLLTPVLEGIAEAFMYLFAPVKWLADLFMWVGSILQTFVHNITHPFDKRSYEKFSSDAFSSIKDQTNTIENIGGGYGELVTTGSSSTGLANASYQGGGSVTINIYQQAPVVGDSGMTQFARMIRSEFEELAYYGA